ncbi:MAG: hypothetical protein NAG76_13565 [Candidatus Pristimantibacillus lignocellulolyticus]|uniref:Uncharacterized protein n=1 Tax=Candidatus Pristimantibacillus lignocellulolyticus TaxID=2994561 RepID=A0A9J6Z9I0_9BACL|nr:MAG: hypothetical protein NAG76_13565 [Candidatus Pristimantibacillus lignocellulolyticus]
MTKVKNKSFLSKWLGGVNISDNINKEQNFSENIFLFPSMLDQYQIELTKLLEREQFEEAKDLLRFLLRCQGDERQHAIEWEHLLNWLEESFPTVDEADGLEHEDLEEQFRRAALSDYGSTNSTEAASKLMDTLKSSLPMDQQMLALERATYLDAPELDEQLINWLQEATLSSAVQFKALQCLKKRGCSGTVQLTRMDETVNLLIEETPLSMNEFPDSVNAILEKAVSALEQVDVTMPILVTELWLECLQCIYGTRSYGWMLNEEEYIEDCFAAGLHHTMQLIVYGYAVDDDIRETYGITNEYRFRYEQASRVIREVALYLQDSD